MRALIPGLILLLAWSAFCVYAGWILRARQASYQRELERKDAQIAKLQEEVLDWEWRRLSNERPTDDDPG